MNQLEVQLSYLKGVAKAHHNRRHLRSSAMIWGNEEEGFRLCSCQTEKFVNYSGHQVYTRAALISTWMVAYTCYQIPRLGHVIKKYNFIEVDSHGCYDHMCPSWLISPYVWDYRRPSKTFLDYNLIWDFLEQALLVLKQEDISPYYCYQIIMHVIDNIKENHDAQLCLKAALDYVFPEEAKIYEYERPVPLLL